MRNYTEHIGLFNDDHGQQHSNKLSAFQNAHQVDDTQLNNLITSIQGLQIAIPSWALGTGGTRFGRFPLGGEPRSLEEKIEDVGLLHTLTQATNSISLHIPWDIPKDIKHIKGLLKEHDIKIDAVNSNTFQDQSDQHQSYRYGSLCHTEKEIRDQAIAHNLEVIEQGVSLGSNTLSVWLADGSNFPGHHNFRQAYSRTAESLQEIYNAMPGDWTMLIEYKPYEPNFYSMVLPDWGTSLKMSEACGERAHVLVDLGHHLPNTNIEQIVARLLHFGRLGGFHFNGSQYGDDDLTTGSIKPYQLFLIFQELISGRNDAQVKNPAVAYMIDASHNIKDPLEDLMQSLENIRMAQTKALLVDADGLKDAQQENDVVRAEQILRSAFETDVRPLIGEARLRAKGCIDPISFFRNTKIRQELISLRGKKTIATGL